MRRKGYHVRTHKRTVKKTGKKFVAGRLKLDDLFALLPKGWKKVPPISRFKAKGVHVVARYERKATKEFLEVRHKTYSKWHYSVEYAYGNSSTSGPYFQKEVRPALERHIKEILTNKEE